MRFSIVVTTFNRPAELQACLAALARLDYPRDGFEVIVVDDGGTAPLERVTADAAGLLQVRLVRKENGGPASGRNLGARAARGEYLAFTDDDCEPDPSWLTVIEERLRRTPHAAIGGLTVNGLVENPYSVASQAIVDVVYAWYNRNPEQARFLATNNLVVPARLYQERGALDDRMRVASEDREFCRRWRHRGGVLIFEPRAVVVHRHVLTLGSYLRQHFNYGRGAALYHRGSRRYGGDGGLRAQMSFYPGCLPRFLRTTRKARLPWPRALALFLFWQSANAAGYLRETLGCWGERMPGRERES